MRNLTMDGFLSSLIAAESIVGCRAVVHGPGGCRSHAAHLSPTLLLREYEVVEGPFFFNNPRVPGTYVDEEDYVNGADYKVTELLDRIDDAEVCVVVQSPGTSLIGDDLTGAAVRSRFKGVVVTPEVCHMSEPMHVGYDSTMADIVRNVCTQGDKVPGNVNIIGIPVLLQGWETTVEELRIYLEAMGLNLVAAVGAGCTVDELKESSSSELCIPVLPEFCRMTAEAYDRLGVPTISAGIPVGFEATRGWITAVADSTGRDPSPALEILSRSEERAKRVLEGSPYGGISTRCATYSIHVDSELVLPLMRWLYDYLSMFPECVMPKDWWSEEYMEELEGFLASINRSDAIGPNVYDTRVDVTFADGISAKFLEKRGTCSAGIDIWHPSRHRMQFREWPVLGASGALRMLDDIFYWIQR